MSENSFQFYIQGINSEKAAEQLAEIIKSELGVSPSLSRVGDSSSGEVTRTDPIAITALILAIPSAVLATMQIIDRAKRKKQLDTLLTQVRQLQERNSEVRLHLKTPKGEVLEFHSLSSAKILDEAAAKP